MCAALTPFDEPCSIVDDHQTMSPSVSKMYASGWPPECDELSTPVVVTMKPFAAPVPGIVFTIFGAPAGTAPVVNAKVALMQVLSAECATMRNEYGWPPFMPS